MVASLSITGTGLPHGLTSQSDVAMAELYMMFEKKDTVLSERARQFRPRSTKLVVATSYVCSCLGTEPPLKT